MIDVHGLVQRQKEIYVLLACASSARMGIYLLQGCISWTDYRYDFQFFLVCASLHVEQTSC